MFKKTDKLCLYPFWHIEIDCDGNVSCCCPDYTNFYFFGNIFKQSFEEIWNGKKRQNFLKDIIKRKYSKCNLEMCMGLDENQFADENDYPLEQIYGLPSPRFVTLSLDSSCNVQCIFCRDEKRISDKHELKAIMDIVDDRIIPMLSNTEIVTLNGAGELFTSKFCKELIKKAVKKYPNLKFDLFTNGLLCNEKVLDLFNLTNRINMVTVSIHATTKKTYNQIIKYSDFDKVMENCKYLSNLKKDGKIEDFALTFVVNSLNYKEMPDFIELAASLDAYPNLWPIRPFNNCKVCRQINKYDVTKKEHPNHKDFLEVLKNPVFKKYNILVNGQITSLIEE